MGEGSGRVRGIEYAEIPKDIEDQIFDYIENYDIPFVKWFTDIAGVEYQQWVSSVKRLRDSGFAFVPKATIDAIVSQLSKEPDLSVVTHKRYSRMPTTKKLIGEIIFLKISGLPVREIAKRVGITVERAYALLSRNIRPISDNKMEHLELMVSAGISMEYICARLMLTPQEVKHYRKEEL